MTTVREAWLGIRDGVACDGARDAVFLAPDGTTSRERIHTH